MKLVLNIWRQASPDSKGDFERHELNDVSPDMSFLEMLDVLNETLTNSNRPRLSSSSSPTWGTTPSGMPLAKLMTISMRLRRTSV